MAGDDRVKAGYDWIEVELVEIVEDIECGFPDFHHLGGLETGRPGTFVDVSADRNNGRDGSEPFQDGEGADVPGVDDEVRAHESRDRFGSEQTVGIGDHTKPFDWSAQPRSPDRLGAHVAHVFSVWLSLDREDMNGLDHQLHPIANLESELIDRLCGDD